MKTEPKRDVGILYEMFVDWGDYFGRPQAQPAHVVEGEIIDIDHEVIDEEPLKQSPNA